MLTTRVDAQSASSQSSPVGDLARLGAAIEEAAHLLPSQGPITVFVHHNTLHAFEDLPFFEAIERGSQAFGCEPLFSEQRYREKLAAGRLRRQDLEAVLREDLLDSSRDQIDGLGSRYNVRFAMAYYPLRAAPNAELKWLIAETEALHRFRDDVSLTVRSRMIEETRHWAMRHVLTSGNASAVDDGDSSGRDLQAFVQGLEPSFESHDPDRWSQDQWEAFCLKALWRVCHQGAHGNVPAHRPKPRSLRLREPLLTATGEDSDLAVHDVLIRMTSAFLDQGLAQWELPDRDQGLFRAFVSLYSQPGGPPNRWMAGLNRVLQSIQRNRTTPLESIAISLQELGVPEEEWNEFLLQTFLALRGWAGIIWQMETRGDRVVRPAPAGTLIEFLAMRLVLERVVTRNIAQGLLNWSGTLADLRRHFRSRAERHAPFGQDQRTFQVFQLAQVCGWSPVALLKLTRADWKTLFDEIDAFDEFERRRILHLAFERRYLVEAMDALSLHSGKSHEPQVPVQAQVICCIDDREESFRRHLEEVCPAIETFAVAGFYGVAMNYQGAADAHFSPLCPIVVRPRHWVVEDVVSPLEEAHRLRARARRALGKASHQVHLGSRSYTSGAVLATVLGPLASLPMVTRILFPRFTARLRRMFGQFVKTPPITSLRLERSTPEPGPKEGAVGYSLQEMAGIVERTLQDLGLTSRFARLVLFIGHGSSSLNNPHESAYNCGACAGSRGGPNARAIAQMANDQRVRSMLAERDIVIPPETFFIGAFHNTCNDEITFFDLDRLPGSHRKDFESLRTSVDAARERNALERCRRFESAPLTLTPEAALAHVENRAEDLAQARPEFNHATNALCIVARRSRTRGLFLDRRAFLNSYDPIQDDDDHSILARILQAAAPVCAGINLEYFFSTVDDFGWGCGNKLPHNVVSLLGVMEGAASDLRTGLSSQMVEIHEPLRLLFVVETTPEAMLSIMERNGAIRQLVENEWMRLALLAPDSSQMKLYRNGKFEDYSLDSQELPQAKSSIDWFRGWRDHLGFAAIDDPSPSALKPAEVGTRGGRS